MEWLVPQRTSLAVVVHQITGVMMLLQKHTLHLFSYHTTCRRLRQSAQLIQPCANSLGSRFGVLIVDCWWGWLDASFRDFVKQSYPWIRLLFVPAGCTPVAQPMDAGIIAKVKGILRAFYGVGLVILL